MLQAESNFHGLFIHYGVMGLVGNRHWTTDGRHGTDAPLGCLLGCITYPSYYSPYYPIPSYPTFIPWIILSWHVVMFSCSGLIRIFKDHLGGSIFTVDHMKTLVNHIVGTVGGGPCLVRVFRFPVALLAACFAKRS